MDLGKECSKYFTVSVNDSTKPQDANHRNVTTEYNLNPNKKDLGFIRTSPWRAIRIFHEDTKLTILALLPTWFLYEHIYLQFPSLFTPYDVSNCGIRCQGL